MPRPRARTTPTSTIRVDHETRDLVETLSEESEGELGIVDALAVLVREGWRRVVLPYDGGRCVVEWSPLTRTYVTSFVTRGLPPRALVDALNGALKEIESK